MAITIRKAEEGDCSRILELIKELASFEKAPHEVTISPRHFKEAGFGPNPVWWAFVAEDERNDKPFIVAFALYYVRFSTWKGAAMYVEDILVTEKMRGQGIGTMLFNRLIDEAKEKGFKRITWQVLDWNWLAINFYKKYSATFDGEWVNCAMEV